VFQGLNQSSYFKVATQLVTAKMGVPRESTTRVVDLIVFRVSGDYGTVTGKGLRPSVLWTQGRGGVDREWGFLSVERRRGTQQHAGGKGAS